MAQLPAETPSMIVGIDIGGTKMSAAGVFLPHAQATAELLAVCQVATPESTEAFFDALVSLVTNVRQQLKDASKPEPTAIGIAVAGMVNPHRGEIVGSTANLRAVTTHPFPIAATLSERVGLPTLAENDANAAAYGEFRAGVAMGAQHVLMITLGTGVGGGLVVNGQLIHGAGFSTGEVGHITLGLTPDRQCTCGRWNCWEAYASGTGLAHSTRQALKQQPETEGAVAIHQHQPIETIGTHALMDAFANGNPLAKTIIADWHTHIAEGLGSLMNVLDPDMAVIGGGLAKFVDMPLLLEKLGKRCMAPVAPHRVVKAQLGNKAGMVGAACLALNRYTETNPSLTEALRG
ncbi:MAG: ROK family protein [Candidatus Melainabacteria bacterium]|nr:ROK family protein [Candidatus Melainabacteria bacterium]